MDVRGDLAQERGRDIAAGVEGHRGGAAIGMTELLVRAALPGLAEAVGLEESDDLPRLEDRQAAHGSGDLDGAHVDELRLERRLAVLEQHLDDLAQVLCCSSSMSAPWVRAPGQPGT